MTLLDVTPRRSSADQAPNLDAAADAEVVTITDTTELRWFAEGQLPPQVAAWFTNDATSGLVEQRCDTYRMDGRFDTGLKRRSGETLELKVRRSVGERLVVGPGLAGRLEVWRRWSPAGCLVTGSMNVPWVDVRKTVVKRRFSVTGDEIALAPGARAMIGAGCEVEVAAVSVNGIEGWTFAFAAFGPIEQRRSSLLASMEALARDGSHPERLGPFFGPSSGYPEWLALVASRTGAVSTCALRQR